MIPNARGCPGCGAPIGRTAVACAPCYDALPVHLRRALNAADPLEDVTTYLNARNDALAHLRATRTSGATT